MNYFTWCITGFFVDLLFITVLHFMGESVSNDWAIGVIRIILWPLVLLIILGKIAIKIIEKIDGKTSNRD